MGGARRTARRCAADTWGRSIALCKYLSEMSDISAIVFLPSEQGRAGLPSYPLHNDRGGCAQSSRVQVTVHQNQLLTQCTAPPYVVSLFVFASSRWDSSCVIRACVAQGLHAVHPAPSSPRALQRSNCPFQESRGAVRVCVCVCASMTHHQSKNININCPSTLHSATLVRYLFAESRLDAFRRAGADLYSHN